MTTQQDREQTSAADDGLEQRLIEAEESGVSERTVLDIMADVKRKRAKQALTPSG